MAIDSAGKRRSFFSFCEDYGVAIPTPDSSKDANWRSTYLFLYPGIETETETEKKPQTSLRLRMGMGFTGR